MITTIEAAAELHLQISQNAPHPGGLWQSITSLQGWATNQEAQSITFKSRIAPSEVTDPLLRRAFMQGFDCVEVNIVARWGGHHHSGAPRTGTDFYVHVLDRLAGGMAQKTWFSGESRTSSLITFEEVIPLVRQLLGQESLEVLQARKKAAADQTLQEQNAWFRQFGPQL